MSLSLQEALDRPEGGLSIDELNSLLPQTVSTVLAMEGAEIGATVGDWMIIENSDGHKGFQAQLPAILGDQDRLLSIFQMEPKLLSVYISTLGEVKGGILDFREHESPETKEANENPQGEVDYEKLTKELLQLNFVMVAWLLNSDLFNFLSGNEILGFQHIAQEIRQDLEKLTQERLETEEEPKKKKRRRKIEERSE